MLRIVRSSGLWRIVWRIVLRVAWRIVLVGTRLCFRRFFYKIRCYVVKTQ